MSINFHILTASERLKSVEKELRTNLRSYIKTIKKYLPLENIDIIVLDSPENTIPHLGVSGYTPDAHVVYIYLDPTHKKFKDTINIHLLHTLAHELHHAMRWKTVGYGTTLFEALITEGLADHFDAEVTKVKPPQIWNNMFSQKEINKFLRKAQKEFTNKNYNHQDWFFGSKKRKIPKWTGYALGYHLVQRYFDKYPDKKPSNLYKTKADEFKI